MQNDRDLLRSHSWEPSYSHEDGDLVDLFFLPALSCSKLYQRVTGYFNKEALSLASRGLDSLLRNDGRMQLIVGCTLEQDEVDKIEAGYALRTLIQKGIHKHLLEVAEKEWERERLGWLAWMIAHEYLDIKLAIPKDTDGKYRVGLGLYHAKAGLMVDAVGDKLAFRGSINETFAGWKQNCESFDVSCSWRGEWDLLRVQKTEDEFQKLWANKAKSAEVIDVPEAVKRELLQFLPKDDSFFRPPVTVEMPRDAEKVTEPPVEEPAEVIEEVPEPKPELSPEELTTVARRPACGDFWRFIRDAAKREDGVMVAVKTSTVEPWPHQLRAYKRMLDHWPFRLLVAEEVGLGKTIEAGFILRHLWLSERARRILIMVPKGILRQWQAEMYEKFNLLVPIYTGHSLVWPEHHFRQRPLEEKISREDWTKQPVVLVSSHLVRRKERQNDVLEVADWDLIILDEAHHARRRGAGTAQERGPNRLLGLMKKLEKKTQSLLLMTATPMQMHPVEIWDLLNLLGLPPEWTEEKFNDYFETLAANPDEEGLHRLAKLFQITEAIFGPLGEGDVEKIAQGMKLSGIDRTKVLKALREKSTPIPLKRLTTKQRQAALAVLRTGSPIRHLMLRHTRILLREYAKKGLLNSPIADRDVRDVPVEMTAAERGLYDAVEDYIRAAYMAAPNEKKTAVGFVMTVYRRRVASSFFALRKTLEKKLARLGSPKTVQADEAEFEEDVPQDEQVDEVASAEDAARMEAEALQVEQRESIQQLLKAIAKLGTDSKALRLITELEDALASEYGGAIVFTQYADTMEFLKDFVGDRVDLPIGCYSGAGGQRRDLNGRWSTCSKEEIKRLLRTREIKLLICTDAAGEGLNLQSCGVVVNYDLPWNPMKVEQRIGRIDRIGQRFPVVRVVNLGYADTVEVDVYFALSMRIGLFKGVVGKMQPILSRLPKEFERAVLGGAAGREQARQEAVSNVNVMIDEAEAAAFDIDAVSEADLQPPQFPEPPCLPKDVDAILHRQDLLPAGVECKQLEPGTYAVRIPGCKGTARITALPEIFDEHFESHQLFLPGSPIFDAVCARGIGLADTPG